MSTEKVPAAVQPADDVVLTFLGTDAGFRSRLEASLVRRKLPALLLQDISRGAFRPVAVRLLADEKGQPLRWVTHGVGVHGFEPVEWPQLIVDLTTELDSVVDTGTGIFGGAAGYPWADEGNGAGQAAADDAGLDAELAAFDQAFTADSFAWYSPGDTDAVSVLARRSGEAWTICTTGAGYVAAPTESPKRVFESFYWGAPKGGMFLARIGNRRGAGFCGDAGLQIHWWDEDWTTVDPSKPWDMDDDGQHVRDYLDLLLPEADAEPWAENFSLDAEHAEELRILLRHDYSDESTFDRLVSAVGLPPLLADVASGHVKLREVAGAETIEPSTMWRALTNMARDEWQRPIEYPRWARFLATWPEHWRRRSGLYLTQMTVAFLAIAVPLGRDLAFGEEGMSPWWHLAGLTLLVIDVCRPRPKPDAEPAAEDGNPSPDVPL